MSDHPLSPPAWIFWLLAVLTCVAFASTFDSLDGLTVALVIGALAAGLLSIAWLLMAPLLSIMDAWDEAKRAAASPAKPVVEEVPARAHQFSLKRLFLGMAAGAILWRILSTPFTETPSLVLALGLMIGLTLAFHACAVGMELSHDLLRGMLRRVACLLRSPPEDSR